jgi:membrane fusion protein
MGINSQESNEKPGQPLFRPEALASSGHQWLGSLRIAQPISAPILTCVALLIVLAIVVFVSAASFTKRSKAVGVTVPVSGSISVAAPAAGVLSRRLVMEGEWVQKGQLIYEISTERQGANGELTAVVENQLNSRAASIGNEISARNGRRQSAWPVKRHSSCPVGRG